MRTGSYLADPATYADFLATIKDPSQTVVAVIAGDPESTISTGSLIIPGQSIAQDLALLPSCTATINGDQAVGRPGIRLDSFRSHFTDDEHGVFETICQSDYSGALAQIGGTVFAMMSDCLEGDVDPTDVDAANPGLQPACTVTFGPSDLAAQTTAPAIISACAMLDASTPDPSGARPCWWVQPAAACVTRTTLELQLEGIALPSPTGNVIDARCARSPAAIP